MNMSYFYLVLSYLILSGGSAAIIILHYKPYKGNSFFANLVQFRLVTFALRNGFLPANSYRLPNHKYFILAMNMSYFYLVLSYLILSGGSAAIIILHYKPYKGDSFLANLVQFRLVTFALRNGFLPANSYRLPNHKHINKQIRIFYLIANI